MSATLGWYARRLRQMSPAEISGRARDRCRKELWRLERALPALAPGPPPAGTRAVRATRRLPDVLAALGAEPSAALIEAADDLVKGRWPVLGIERDDLEEPDWSWDPVSGRRYSADRYAFSIDYRSAGDDRRVKQVWELSRHQHLTVLAAAWQLTGEEVYAATVDRHLRSWWRGNPILSGINWASGIELGIRLVSWAWIRRLLEGWPGASALFEENEEARRQVYAHQRYLAAFASRGSSANNHVIAEAAGQLVASCALAWFAESDRWRREAADLLERELHNNTFPSGLNRELAFEYHGLVAELGILAATEAEVAGAPLSRATWGLLCRMVDVVAAVVDCAGRPPRQGDADDGRALLLAAPGADRWRSLLALGRTVFGAPPWWPEGEPDATSLLVGALLGRRIEGGARATTRPSTFADAGLTLLRSGADGPDELWVRCDGGPHGFLSIAAHAHADALSIEVRHRGVDVLADPGTYCYQGEPAWRSYFRSTVAHNTVEVDGRDQSESGGPFLWVRHARTRVHEVSGDGSGPTRWLASHDGYAALADPVLHRRTVSLVDHGLVEVRDELVADGAHALRMALHLGPAIEVLLEDEGARLEWTDRDGIVHRGELALPADLEWAAYRASLDPILGWYSPAFGRRVPSTTLVGCGSLSAATLVTRLRIDPVAGFRS